MHPHKRFWIEGPLQTRDREPVSVVALQAFPLVGKGGAGPSSLPSHYVWGTNRVCECKMDAKSTWMPTWHRMDMFHAHLDNFQKPPLGGRRNTKPGVRGTPDARDCWFILFCRGWRTTWIDICWNNIWLRDKSRMTSHCTWGSMTTLHDFGGVLGQRPLNTFFWALTMARTRLLARSVWSGPNTLP